MFLGICTGISSSMANSVKFSAIFLLPGAELVPRVSRRMGAKVAKARNMSIGEHQHCCATFKI